MITNQNGQVISRKDYMTYGDEVPSSTRTGLAGYDQAQETRKGYTGYEKDVESGLEFAQARYYNAKVGRFTSIDPLTASANIKDPQTFNRYTYAMNSPYKFTDPLGLVANNTGANGGGPSGAWCSTCVDRDERGFPIEGDTPSSPDPSPSGGTPVAEETSSNSSPPAQSGAAPSLPPAPEQSVNSEASTGELDGIDISMVYSVSTGKLKIIITKPVYGLEDKVWTEEFSGTSGTEKCINNPDCANDTAEHKDQGPIPLGNYTLNSAEISDLTGISVAKAGKVVLTGIRSVIDTPSADWGSFRVPLNPDSQLKFRSGFFLHGGSFPGSKGCIDVGGGEYGNEATGRIQSLIKADGGKAIPLKVIK